LTRKQDITA